jgi:hypothetical protein
MIMDLTERQLPVMETSSEGKLAVALHFKMLASLHDLGKLDDEELAKVASALIAELPGVQERFEAWTLIDSLVPDFKRPDNAEA